MKKLIFLAIIFLAIIFLATQAMSASLKWDANTDSTTGYIVYSQEQGVSEIFSEPVIEGRENTTFELDPTRFMPGKTYTFWVTACNALAESGPSNTVDYFFPKIVHESNPRPVIINIPESVTVTINIP